MVWQEKGAVKYSGRSVIFLLQVVCSVSDFWGSDSSIHSMIWARPTALFILGLPKM